MWQMCRHVGVDLTIEDWEKVGYDVPLVVNMQPAGEHLGEAFHRAGGVRAVMHEMLKAGKLHGSAMTVAGTTVAENAREALDRNVIKPHDAPMMDNAGFLNLGPWLDNAAINVCPARRPV